MATLNRTFSVKNGIDVANTIIVDSSRNISNIVTANAVTVNANTYLTVAGLNVTDQANAAYSAANLALINAGQANVVAKDAYAQANAARDQANTGLGQANAAYAQANAAYGQANTARDVANAAYGQANTARTTANDAYAQANTSGNTVRVSANAGSTLSNKQLNFNNSASIQVTVADSGDGNANIVFNTTGAAVADAYAQANAAYLQANTARGTANDAYAQANSNYQPAVTRLDVSNSGTSAYLFDQYGAAVNNPTLYIRGGETLAFNLNNAGHPFVIRVSSGGSNSNTGLTHVATNGAVTTGSNAQGKVSGTLYWKVPYELIGNTYVYQCTAHAGMVGNIVIEPPMVVAYAQANTARDTANGAYAQANGAYAQANGAYGQANGAFAQANGAYAQANGAYAQANGAYAQANGAYSQANLKVASITVSGNGLAVSNATIANNNEYTLSVNTATTTVRGITLLVDSTSSIDTSNAATANAVNATFNYAATKLPLTGGSLTGDLTISGNLVVQGNSTIIEVSNLSVNDSIILLSANATGDVGDIGFVGHFDRGATATHAGIVRIHQLNEFQFFDNYELAPTNNVIDIANYNYRLGNVRVNTINANSVLILGNAAATQANLTLAHNQANAAYAQANAAYGDANTRVLKAGDTMTGGLTITTSGIGLTVANANVTFSLQVGTLNVTSNTVTTSSSGQVVLDKFPTTQLASAKYFVQAKSGSDYHTTEVVLVQDATNVFITEYGSIQTGPSLGSFSADISSGDVRLLFNANNNVNTIRSVRYGIIP